MVMAISDMAPFMDNGRYNVLILDPGSHKKNTLQEMLNKAGFNVHLASSEEDAAAVLDLFRPDIILCRASSAMIKDERSLCEFHDSAAGRNIPFVVVSTGVDVDFYLKILERGISHTINPPFSVEFLVARIKEILSGEITAEGDDPVSISFIYRGAGHTLRISPSRLVHFIISMLNNTVNHSSALTAAMHNKNRLQQKLGGPVLFDEIRTRTESEISMEEDIRRGLEQGEFILHYQPIISLADSRIAGFEALIRWDHPRRGLLPPQEFIPQAERLPLIIPLGFWVIEEAVKQLRMWQDVLAISEPFHVSINLSANQFVNPGLSDGIVEIMEHNHVDPAGIAFEITETAFMTDMKSANLQLLRLKSNGHNIFMDDFGTGYSSLSYLQYFPIDIIKIDQSFVRWMHMDEHSEAIVRSVISLAHNLRLKVVAEGVEEHEHMVSLTGLGSDFVQGYLISRPLDVEEAGEYLKGFFRIRQG